VKRVLLAVADAVATVWLVLPQRLRQTLIKGVVVLESRGSKPEKGLARLFAIEDDLQHVINERAMVLGKGVHPKHRLMGYHDFFVERITDGEQVLDVGCGYGAVARSIAKAHPKSLVVGVDNDAGRLSQARAADNPPNLEFVACDATKSVPEGDWDVVVLSNVLEHITLRPEFLSALISTTKARKFLIRVPLFERHWTLPMRREVRANYFSDPDHKIEPTRAELLAEARSAGLELTEMITLWGEIWATFRPIDGRGERANAWQIAELNHG
jgi:2-polyprenyl-3-methyl-5-hydroxy-6-metoxy-1,4-benzoquinol methylase